MSRDIGTAHNGLNDWYWQRLTAIVLLLVLPLPFVLIAGLYSGAIDQLMLLEWVDHLVARLLHTLLIVAVLFHVYIGLKVICEDYLHATVVRIPVIGLILVGLSGIAIWWMSIVWALGG